MHIHSNKSKHVTFIIGILDAMRFLFTILCNLENAQGRSDGKYDEKGSADDGNCLLRNVLGNVSSTDHSNASSDAAVDY